MASEYHSEPSFAAKILRLYMRCGLRGHERLTAYLSRNLSSLQAVPITVDGATLFIDLRMGGSHELLKGSPWSQAPIEQLEQDLMRRLVRQGDVVFDIGANVGLHTLLLSQLVGQQGRVFAFEPNPRLRTTLRATVHELPNTHLLSFALSDQTGESTLFVPEDHTMASLADWTKNRLPSSAQEALCQRRRLDDLIQAGEITQPDFIKCDVEGAELMVFKGGRQVLDRIDAPMILFEVNTHTAHGFDLPTSAAFDFLKELPLSEYRFFEIDEKNELASVHIINTNHANILAVPRSKLDRFSVP